MVEVITGWHLNESVRGRFSDWTQYTLWRYDCFGLDWIIAKRSNCTVHHQIAISAATPPRPHESNLRRRVDIDSLSTRTTQVGMRLWLRLRLRLRARRVALARHVYRSRQHFSINPKPAKNAFKKKKQRIFGYDIPCNRLCGTLWRSCFLSKLVRKKK